MRARSGQRQWLLAAILAGLLPACRPSTAPAPVPVRPHAAWMEARHPGPFTALGDVELGLSERCTACHQFSRLATVSPLGNPHADPDSRQRLAARRRAVSAAPPPDDPLAVGIPHPGGWLRWHNPARFACTACHAGRGGGASYSEASHSAMLPLRDAAGRLSPQLQARCGVCHAGENVPGAPLLSRGRSLIRELNCAGCHTVSPQLAGARHAPSLARVAEKLGPELLLDKPRHAVDWQGPVGGQMPQFDQLDDETCLKLAAYLQSLTPAAKRVRQRPAAPTGQPDPAGLAVLRRARCANCHALPATGLPADDPLRLEIAPAQIGPSLERIHERVTADWLAGYLAAPGDWYPGTRMPAYALSLAERSQLAQWLVQAARLQADPAAAGQPAAHDPRQLAALEAGGAALAAAGREEFVANGCAGCHATGDPQLAPRPIGPSLVGVGDKQRTQWPDKARSNKRLGSLADYLAATLADSRTTGPGRMPRFQLAEADVAALTTALLAETAAVWPGTAQALPARYVHELAPPLRPPGGAGPGFARSFWEFPVAPQGSGGPGNRPGAVLSLAERDLRPSACAVCHRAQYIQWRGSRHALAMSPGVTGQLAEWVEAKPEEYMSCLKCHANLAEQSHIRRTPAGRWEDNPHYGGDELYLSANGCANCHVRAHARYGPARQREDYAWKRESLVAHQLERSAFLADSGFCADCHQFDPAQRISNGPPLQNTHAEHAEWLQHAAQPRSCQDCHMPQGTHAFQGIHDPAFVRASLDIQPAYSVAAGRLQARLTLVNARGGHHFPTYVTPRVFIRGYFSDAAGKQLGGTLKEMVLGRDARNREKPGGGVEWFDVFDTRVPAGAAVDFDYAAAIPAGARSFRLEVFCAPDHFYYEVYDDWLAQDWRSPDGKAQLQLAREQSAPQRTGFYLFRDEYRF